MAKVMMSKEEIQAKVGVNLFLSFWVMLVVNVLVIFLAHLLFPMGVVLGTHSLSMSWALILSMSLLSLLCVWGMQCVAYHEWRRGKEYSPKDWMVMYFVLDVVSVWVIARFASHLGFGIAHWWVALLLGVVLDFVQGISMMGLGKVLFLK